ncbi:MAG: hypothetical protein ACLSCV_07605 [Acutalibacteraceae bacterium]
MENIDRIPFKARIEVPKATVMKYWPQFPEKQPNIPLQGLDFGNSLMTLCIMESNGHRGIWASIAVKARSKEYLLKIKIHGIRLGVCTVFTKVMLPCLQNNNIYKLFDACISQMTSAEVKIILMLGYCVQHV